MSNPLAAQDPGARTSAAAADADGTDRGDAPPAEPVVRSHAARRAMVGPCDATCRWISGALAIAGIGALTALDAEDNATIGGFTRLLPPVAGLAMALAAGDTQGLKQWFLVGSSSLLVTEGLKSASDKERPDAADRSSFPSGHATIGFFGAGFISRRYGPRWGVPAWVLAAYTGASRVDAERHYMDDVVSSLSIGLMSNWLVTTPISDRVAVNPMLTGEGFGVSVSFPRSSPIGGDDAAEGVAGRPPRYRYQWELGPVKVPDNLVNAGGEPIDFRFEALNDPVVSASIALEWFPATRRQDIGFRFTPFEIRDFGSFAEDTEFGGVTFPAGEDLRTRHVAYDLTARYRYRVLRDSRIDLRVGGGAAVLYTLAGLAPTASRQSVGHLDFTEEKSLEVLPIVHLRIGLELGSARRWLLFAEGDGIDLGAHRYLDATAQLRFQAGPRWDVGLGYRHLERDIVSQALRNTTRRSQVVADIGYRF